ncbi:MAG: sel1 repeat family protein, partial [Rhodoferax sp.]|nr:sel1 repeat family protein [Rhodoferax sp.]
MLSHFMRPTLLLAMGWACAPSLAGPVDLYSRDPLRREVEYNRQAQSRFVSNQDPNFAAKARADLDRFVAGLNRLEDVPDSSQKQTPIKSVLEQVQERANAGDAAAMRALAGGYATGTRVPKDMAQALQWFTRAADAGDAFSQSFMGWSLLTGMHGKRDAVRGLDYLKRGVAQQQPEALAYLGIAQSLGLGTPARADEALPLLRSSAVLGSPVGAFALGATLRAQGDAAGAAHWLERAAVPGNPQGLAAWGDTLARGIGVATNPARGLALVQQAADAGDPSGLETLGNFYYEGVGTVRDAARAVQFW